MDLDEVVKRIVATMRVREEAEGKEFGVIVLAEGLAEFLPYEHIEGVPRDEHGHIAITPNSTSADFSPNWWRRNTPSRPARSGRSPACSSATRAAAPGRRPSTSCWAASSASAPIAALVEKRLDGVMVSVPGQFELNYVPFDQLVDPATLVTVVRYIEPGSDFHRLARFLETYVND